MSNAKGRVWSQFRLRTALLAVLYLAILLSVVATWRATWRYKAAAWLRVHGRNPSTFFRTDDTLDAVEPIRMAMLTEVLTSEAVMERAADRLERQGFRGFAGAESRAGWVAEHVRCSWPGSDEILEVRCAASDPQTAVHVVDAVVDGYLEVLGEIARDRPDALLERLCRQLAPATCLDFQERFCGDPRWVIGPGALSALAVPRVADGELSWVAGPDTTDVIVAPSVVRRVSNDTVLWLGIPLWLLLGLLWIGWAAWAKWRLRAPKRLSQSRPGDLRSAVSAPSEPRVEPRLR